MSQLTPNANDVQIFRTLWIGGGDLPILPLMSARSFLRSGYRHEIFSYEPITNLPEGCVNRDAKEIIDYDPSFVVKRGYGKGQHAIFADLFRYKMLYHLGGWWADTDVICLKPFDSGEYFFGPERNIFGIHRVNNALIKSPAGSRILKHCLDRCHTIDVAKMSWGDTGPRLLSEATTTFKLKEFIADQKEHNPINYTQFGSLFKPIEIGNEWKTIHLWNSMWKERKIDQNGKFGDCLYSTICDRFR